MKTPLAVSVTGALPEPARRRARACATAWGLPFLPRGQKEWLASLFAQADALLLFEPGGVLLRDGEGSYRFHTGVAHLRLLDQAQGAGDRMARAGELRAGDRVLDCTLGFGQDALVAAHHVGPEGRVVGLERSLPLYAVVSEGLRRMGSRVEARHEDLAAFLPQQPRGSFDVVYFDPMFERPRKSQPAFELLRRFAAHDPLTPEVLEEARRVARRWVVVKGSRYSTDLKKLGLTPEGASRSTPVVFGRIPGLEHERSSAKPASNGVKGL